MNYRLPLLLTLGLLLLPPQVLHAQESGTVPSRDAGTEVITIDRAVQLALDNSIAIRRATHSVELDRVAVSQQRSSFLPDLSLSVSGSQSYGRSFDTTVGELVHEGRTGASGSVGAGITLFDGFSSWAELDQARYALQRSTADLDHARQQVTFEVLSRYLDLIQAHENVRIQEENLEAARRQLERVEDHVRVGTRPPSELYAQQEQVATAEVSLVQAQRGTQEQEMQLIELVQLDPFGSYEFEIPPVAEDDVVPDQYDVAALVDEAFSHRRDLRAQTSSIAASEQGIRAARGGFFPTISLGASVGTGYTSLDPFHSFSDQFFQTNRSESISLSISFPLFDRFQRRNQVRQATIQYETERLNLEEQRQQVAVEIRRAYLDYDALAKELELAHVRQETAERALEAARRQYQVGSGSLVDVSQAQANYVSASSDLVQTQYDLMFHRWRIAYYVGTLDPGQGLF